MTPRLATWRRHRAALAAPVGSPGRLRLHHQILTALRLLVRGRNGAQDWADACGLDRRTAYRLLRALEASGLRIEHQREGRRVYLVARRAEVEDWLWARPIPLPRLRVRRAGT